jgi:parvin
MIHGKDVVAIIQLLISLALHYRAPIRFPNNVNVQLMVYEKRGKNVSKNLVTEQLTTKQTELGPKGERDAFDTLFDYGPDKLQHVKSSLVAFCNKHLNKINLEVTDLETQFQDGVFLILLMGLLEGYFVPLYNFHLQVRNNDEKIKNVQFSFCLMEEAGMSKPKSRVQDIVNGDLKSTLRVLHALFTKYKHV